MRILFALISSIITQWKIACLQKQHVHLKNKLTFEVQEISDKVQTAESRRIELLQEVKELKGL